MSEDHIFVYGTLRRQANSEMYRFLANHANYVAEATYQGKLFRVDYYPGVMPSDDPLDRVWGDVFHLPEPDKILPHLDRYEGIGGLYPEPYEYERVQANVTLVDGQSKTCWIYLYRFDLKGYERIESGDFCATLD